MANSMAGTTNDVVLLRARCDKADVLAPAKCCRRARQRSSTVRLFDGERTRRRSRALIASTPWLGFRHAWRGTERRSELDEVRRWSPLTKANVEPSGWLCTRNGFEMGSNWV